MCITTMSLGDASSIAAVALDEEPACRPVRRTVCFSDQGAEVVLFQVDQELPACKAPWERPATLCDEVKAASSTWPRIGLLALPSPTSSKLFARRQALSAA
mmetsp:Transcript_34065/g.63582  ORF Transcript_34065/g.63582 Transcript_34065/m.63582 type:complete len:101 (+) Transcript_34065:38-340(+)